MSEQRDNQGEPRRAPTIIVRKGPWLGQDHTPPDWAYVEWPPGPMGGPVPGVTCPAEPEEVPAPEQDAE